MFEPTDEATWRDWWQIASPNDRALLLYMSHIDDYQVLSRVEWNNLPTTARTTLVASGDPREQLGTYAPDPQPLPDLGRYRPRRLSRRASRVWLYVTLALIVVVIAIGIYLTRL